MLASFTKLSSRHCDLYHDQSAVVPVCPSCRALLPFQPQMGRGWMTTPTTSLLVELVLADEGGKSDFSQKKRPPLVINHSENQS